MRTRIELSNLFPTMFPDSEHNYVHYPKGWDKLVMQVLRDIEHTGVEIAQIKEKWGALRIYINKNNDEVYEELWKVEKASRLVCQECGEPGVLRGGSWLKTLCDTHSEGRKPFKIEGSFLDPNWMLTVTGGEATTVDVADHQQNT